MGADQQTKYTKAECLFTPCSTDNNLINWAIGCVTYENTFDETESVFIEF